MTWQYPSSWPDPESFPLKFFLRYRPLITDQWQHVSGTVGLLGEGERGLGRSRHDDLPPVWPPGRFGSGQLFGVPKFSSEVLSKFQIPLFIFEMQLLEELLRSETLRILHSSVDYF